LYAKCYEAKDVFIPVSSDEVLTKISDGLPQAALPMPLPILPDDVYHVNFAEVRTAFRKLRKGKACGLSGWNRELLFPIVSYPPPIVQLGLSQLFTDIVNVTISDAEKDFLGSVVLIPLCYRSKPGKVRSVMITDGIVKMAWHIVFDGVSDASVERSGQVYGKVGQTTLAVCAIQAALDRDQVVVSLDAVNAFPSLDRTCFMGYIQSAPQYSRAKALTNLLYSRQVAARWYTSTAVHHFAITSGCLQGCVSGPRYYSIGTVETSRLFDGILVQVADDIHYWASCDGGHAGDH
jgi:hypothetical protein